MACTRSPVRARLAPPKRKPPRRAAFVVLRRAREVVALDDALELVLEPVESVALELAHALAREPELGADLLERRRLAGEAVAQLDDATLALRQPLERPLHRLPAQRLCGVLRRIARGGIAEEVAQLAVAVRADA